MIENVRSDVSELCLNGILNCLKSKTTLGSTYPLSIKNQINDTDIIKFYWAISMSLEELSTAIVENPRRLTTTITYEEREKIGEITGSINAGATVLAQSRTLNPTIFIVNEPNVTYQSEPNFLVAWTLKEALDILLATRRLNKKIEKLEWLNDKIYLLESALRNNVLVEVMQSQPRNKRPNSSAIRSATKSKNIIYQLAVQLYDLLRDIEMGDESAIVTCLADSLLADLEYWQRLELGTALNAAEALSDSTKQPLTLTFPFQTGEPVARVGSYSVYWQYTIPQRSLDKLHINEKWTRELAESIGVRKSDSRADVAVTYNENVVSLYECKYFEYETSAPQAIVDASSQLVRYSLDLNSEDELSAKKLLSSSCVVVANRYKYDPVTSTKKTFLADERSVYFLGIEDLLKNSLISWSKELTI